MWYPAGLEKSGEKSSGPDAEDSYSLASDIETPLGEAMEFWKKRGRENLGFR
jgi:hypothetical protein